MTMLQVRLLTKRSIIIQTELNLSCKLMHGIIINKTSKPAPHQGILEKPDNIDCMPLLAYSYTSS